MEPLTHKPRCCGWGRAGGFHTAGPRAQGRLQVEGFIGDRAAGGESGARWGKDPGVKVAAKMTAGVRCPL